MREKYINEQLDLRQQKKQRYRVVAALCFFVWLMIMGGTIALYDLSILCCFLPANFLIMMATVGVIYHDSLE